MDPDFVHSMDVQGEARGPPSKLTLVEGAQKKEIKDPSDL